MPDTALYSFDSSSKSCSSKYFLSDFKSFCEVSALLIAFTKLYKASFS